MNGLGISMPWEEEDQINDRIPFSWSPRISIAGTDDYVRKDLEGLLLTARSRFAMSSSLSSAPGSVSPQSSPRLPSPPPYPEVQLAPPSPGVDKTVDGDLKDVGDGPPLDNGASRRIRAGTKAANMASGPPLVPLTELNSPFQLQEHLKALHYSLTLPVPPSTKAAPLTHQNATILATPPQNIDSQLWLYELCRALVQQTNTLIVALFTASPPCSAKTCPEMRASEWQYLCAVHDPPKSCAAIDYCCHTLDEAGNMLTSQKHFPSRLTLGTESQGGTQGGFKTLANIYRRVYRMFAHAWFQHREAFEKVEREGGVYVFFKRVCDLYSLIPEDNYTIPPEAEGLERSQDRKETAEQKGEAKREKSPEKEKAPEASGTVRHDQAHEATEKESPTAETPVVKDDPADISTGATTRKHRHTPSTGSLVTTIFEGEEDDGGTEEDGPPPPVQTAIPLLPSIDLKPFEPQKDPIFEETAKETGEKVPNEVPNEAAEEDEATQRDVEGDPPEVKVTEVDDPASGEEKSGGSGEVMQPT